MNVQWSLDIRALFCPNGHSEKPFGPCSACCVKSTRASMLAWETSQDNPITIKVFFFPEAPGLHLSKAQCRLCCMLPQPYQIESCV